MFLAQLAGIEAGPPLTDEEADEILFLIRDRIEYAREAIASFQ